LYLNEKEILISKTNLDQLSQDDIIYDGELFKLNINKNGYKRVIRYFQITKKEFKYYNSIFSSSVWNDRPLYRINLENITNISISNDEMYKIKFNDIKFVFNLTVNNINHAKLETENKILMNLEQIKEDLILEFGCEDPEIGISLIKIIMILNKDIFKNYK
jgi:hypothetical protein